ncbi:MAG TPA: septation protein IspZ [Solimonas sp.]|nr:septation protein IspZ [Solimonas sp.]
MKFVLDLAPAVAFFVAYLIGGIYVATATLIASLFLVVLLYWLIEKRLHKAHAAAAAVAAVLGGLTLAVHDPDFIKYKPTVVYGVFAVALVLSNLFGERVLLARIPQKSVVLPEPVWRRVNLAWALFFVVCAVLNVYIAQRFDEATWVKFKTFGFTALMFVFLLAHAPFLSKYFVHEDA